MRMSDRRLRLALTLARRAGRLAAASRGRAQVSWKGPGDRVTEVDCAIQSGIVSEIHSQFPQDAVVAEEGAARVTIDHEFVWAVDPLNGTNNFALGIPCFAVSIGVLRDGLPHAGVIHDPNTGSTWWARHGEGAYENDRALTLKARPLTEASNIAIRVPVDPDLEPLIRDWLRRYKFRSFGSVALHLVYAAIGALDIVLDHKAKLWDIAAGTAILLEAGGAATHPSGRFLFPPAASAYAGDPMPFLAGNRSAHAQALARLPRGRPDESDLVSAQKPR
jgi:myo-inositol-1(or 4)-monophosphatase